MSFEIIDVSGDAGIRAFGKSLEDLFVNSAMGMYSLITDTETVLEKRKVEVEVEGNSLEGLLVAWLNELIFHFDTYGFIGKEIKFIEFSEKRLKASLSGEDFDESRHEKRLLVKAATYHNLKVESVGGEWRAEVIFDI